MKKRRNQGWVPFLLGLALLLGAWLLLKLIPDLDAEHWRVVLFLALGVGCGLFGSGAGALLAAQAMKKHPELQKQQEINQKDERNVALGNAAKAKAFDVMLTTFSPLLLILALLEIDLLPLLLLVAAYLFVVFDSIYWLNRYQKEM